MIQKNDILLLNQPKHVLNHTKNDYLFFFFFFFYNCDFGGLV